MAGDWIKFEHATLTKPEVYTIADELGMEPEEVIGRLLRLWVWADQQLEKCDAVTVTELALDRISGRNGFATAMRKCGWLDGESGRLTLPNWDRHNTSSAKNRALTKERMKRSRDATSVTSASLEKRREEKKKTNKARGTEEELRTFAVSIELPESDGESAFLKWEGNGWTNGGSPIKDWRSTMRNWKNQGFHPSQKRGGQTELGGGRGW